jgi:anti-sigma factor RsiW
MQERMIRPKRHPSERDLTALADGSLPASRRPRVERAVAASPDLQADLAAQRRALGALAGASQERAPTALRARLELARAPDPARRRVGRSWAAIPAAAAAAAAVIALTLVGASAGAPTVAAAATLASRAPLHPVGPASANTETLRWPTAGGLSFPDWARRFGFVAAGMRTDRLDGRLATTVFYDRHGQRIAYTIVSGRALAVGAANRTSSWGGTQLSSLTANGRAVVTWLRGGHSCVLSGSPALLAELRWLATWKPAAYQG